MTDLAALVAAAQPDELPALIGQLEAAKAAAWARWLAQPRAAAAGPDVNLTVPQAAQRIGMSSQWIYRNGGGGEVKLDAIRAAAEEMAKLHAVPPYTVRPCDCTRCVDQRRILALVAVAEAAWAARLCGHSQPQEGCLSRQCAALARVEAL